MDQMTKVPFTKDYAAKIAAAVSNAVEGCIAVSVIVIVEGDASSCQVYTQASKQALDDALFKALPVDLKWAARRE